MRDFPYKVMNRKYKTEDCSLLQLSNYELLIGIFEKHNENLRQDPHVHGRLHQLSSIGGIDHADQDHAETIPSSGMAETDE